MWRSLSSDTQLYEPRAAQKARSKVSATNTQWWWFLALMSQSNNVLGKYDQGGCISGNAPLGMSFCPSLCVSHGMQPCDCCSLALLQLQAEAAQKSQVALRLHLKSTSPEAAASAE